jgi:hemolysin III
MTFDDLTAGPAAPADAARDARDAAVEKAVAARDNALERAHTVRDNAVERAHTARDNAVEGARFARDTALERAHAARDAAAEAAVLVKPRLRGVVHQWAFFVSLALGAALVVLASGERARVAVLVYAISLSGLLGTSALYHRVTWAPEARRRMRKLDHSMIFVLIAGTTTPIALIAMEGTVATALLIAVWTGTALGIVLSVAWIDAPKWLNTVVYCVVGCSGLFAIGSLLGSVGLLAVAGLALGGAFYLAGAIIYATKRPNPAPAVFGYHEIFHVLVVVAAAVHFVVIAAIVLPA